ncbi:hypothetical protein [Mameliella alba]|uniref:Uncharacterized protein n=1 Tax=Mameliella alba TaxID=561184 RepID=A0A0B3RPU3_9RHOB|nr:hypothetical protein [Mameliella alba]KHQ49827.1 hypothetical protein OA50_05608 [Mameliella alba]
MMRNVRSFYDCSTAHLPEPTAQDIDNEVFAKSPTMRNEVSGAPVTRVWHISTAATR